MTKKKTDKKKISIKLESGQTYLVASIDEMIVVSKALAHLSSTTKDAKDKLDILNLGKKTDESISKNSFTGGVFDEEENWN